MTETELSPTNPDLGELSHPGLEWLPASRAYGRKVAGLGEKLKRRLRSSDIAFHTDGWTELDQPDRKGAYSRTFPFSGDYIDDTHRRIADAPGGRLGIPVSIDLGIDGYLQKGDALKLYELARFTRGDVLEFGTHFGLSTSLIAAALEARGSGRLETVDFNPDTTAAAAENIRGLPGAERVTFTVREGGKRVRELAAEGRRYGFIFVDHWHGYISTRDVAREQHKLLEPGAFVQFHDFIDEQNGDPAYNYGVFQAVLDTVCKDGRFLFCGNYGCTGVFRFLGG